MAAEAGDAQTGGDDMSILAELGVRLLVIGLAYGVAHWVSRRVSKEITVIVSMICGMMAASVLDLLRNLYGL